MVLEKKFCPNCSDESADYDDPFCKKCNMGFVVVTPDKNPMDSELFYTLFIKADELQKQQKFDEAINCYDKLLDINNQNIRALVGKAMCYAEMDNSVEAIYYLDQAINININSITEYLNVYKMIAFVCGSELMNENEYDKAIEYFDKILAIDENYQDAITFKNYCKKYL